MSLAFIPASTGHASLALAVNSMPSRVSPLMIADSLITLAQQADRAGFPATASSLVNMVYSVLDERTAHS